MTNTPTPTQLQLREIASASGIQREAPSSCSSSAHTALAYSAPDSSVGNHSLYYDSAESSDSDLPVVQQAQVSRFSRTACPQAQSVHDRAVHSRKQAQRLRVQLKQVAKQAQKLTTLDRSNARFLKEMACSANREMHSKNGNIDADRVMRMANEHLDNHLLEAVARIHSYERLLDCYRPASGPMITEAEAVNTILAAQFLHVLPEVQDHTRFVPLTREQDGRSYSFLVFRTPFSRLSYVAATGDQPFIRAHPMIFQELDAPSDMDYSQDDWMVSDRLGLNSALTFMSSFLECMTRSSLLGFDSVNDMMHAINGNIMSSRKASTQRRPPPTKKSPTQKSVAQKCKTAAAAVADALQDQKDKMMAAQDALAEKKALEEEQKKQQDEKEKLEALKRQRQVRIDSFTSSCEQIHHKSLWTNESTYEFYFIWTPPSTPLQNWAPGLATILGPTVSDLFMVRRQVSPRLEELMQPIVPHTVVRVWFSAGDLKDPAVELLDKTTSLPLMEKFARLSQADVILNLHIEFTAYGWFWEKVSTEADDHLVPLPLDTLLTVHQELRLSWVSLDCDIEVMTAYLGRIHDSIITDKFDLATSGPFATCCFTCLLHACMSHRLTTSPSLVSYTNARKMIYAALIYDRPSPAGRYFSGYDCSMKDILPSAAVKPVDALVDKACGIVPVVSATAVDAAKKLKQIASYACATPVSISGIKPCFPAHTYTNELLGFVKRLGGKRPDTNRSDLNVVREALFRVLRKRLALVRTTMSPVEITTTCEAHCRAKGFNAGDTDEYMSGCTDFLEGREVTESISDLTGDAACETKCFIKQETYTSTAKKAPRFIIAPTMYVRGYAHASLMVSQHNYFAALGVEHHAKMQTPADVARDLHEHFEKHEWYAETDYTSFESCLDEDLLSFERQVLVLCADPATSKTTESFLRFIGTNTTIAKNRDFLMYLRPMRRSGDDHTSAGNNIQNLLLTLYILLPLVSTRLKDGHVPVDVWECEIRRAFLCRFFKFEGDDGLFHIGHSPTLLEVEAVKVRVDKAGVRLKFDFERDGHSLNFCGNTVMQTVSGARFPVTDWLDKLANATCCFGQIQGDSNRNCYRVAYGKSISYAMTYPHAPVLGKFCTCAAKWYRSRPENRKFFEASTRLAAAGVDLRMFFETRCSECLAFDPFSLKGSLRTDAHVVQQFARSVIPQLPYSLRREPSQAFVDSLFGVAALEPLLPPPPRLRSRRIPELWRPSTSTHEPTASLTLRRLPSSSPRLKRSSSPPQPSMIISPSSCLFWIACTMSVQPPRRLLKLFNLTRANELPFTQRICLT